VWLALWPSNHAIAERLVVNERVAEKHVAGIFGKLGLAPRGDAHRRVLAVVMHLRSS
jgi:DNA-binding NarL/FixJ family response regulator